MESKKEKEGNKEKNRRRRRGDRRERRGRNNFSYKLRLELLCLPFRRVCPADFGLAVLAPTAT